MQNTIKI